MNKVITVAMGKGGVGKSLLAFHLIHAAAEAGPVLALDLDRQGSLLSLLGVPRAQHLAGVLAGFVPFTASMRAPVGGAVGAQVIASDEALVQAETLLMMGGKQPDYLRRLLPSFGGDDDLIVLDTATGGYLSEMALAAADVILVPVAMRSVDADMLPQFLDRVAAINAGAAILVAPNRYDRRTRVSEDVWRRVAATCLDRGIQYGPLMYESVELDASRLSGIPIWGKKRVDAVAAAEAMRSTVDAALALAGVQVKA